MVLSNQGIKPFGAGFEARDWAQTRQRVQVQVGIGKGGRVKGSEHKPMLGETRKEDSLGMIDVGSSRGQEKAAIPDSMWCG
eukprot:3496241-Rhodomonas_salina.2